MRDFLAIVSHLKAFGDEANVLAHVHIFWISG